MRSIACLACLALLAGMILGVGCAPPPPPQEEVYRLKPRPQAGPPMQYTDRIAVLDDSLTNVLRYVNYSQHRLESGQVVFKVNLQNQSRRTVWADVKGVFFDQNFAVIEDGAWMRTQFPPWQITTVEVSSIRADVAKFNVLLRWAR